MHRTTHFDSHISFHVVFNTTIFNLSLNTAVWQALCNTNFNLKFEHLKIYCQQFMMQCKQCAHIRGIVHDVLIFHNDAMILIVCFYISLMRLISNPTIIKHQIHIFLYQKENNLHINLIHASIQCNLMVDTWILFFIRNWIHEKLIIGPAK